MNKVSKIYKPQIQDIINLASHYGFFFYIKNLIKAKFQTNLKEDSEYILNLSVLSTNLFKIR